MLTERATLSRELLQKVGLNRIVKNSTSGDPNSFMFEIETNDLVEARVAMGVIKAVGQLDEANSNLPPEQQGESAKCDTRLPI